MRNESTMILLYFLKLKLFIFCSQLTGSAQQRAGGGCHYEPQIAREAPSLSLNIHGMMKNVIIRFRAFIQLAVVVLFFLSIIKKKNNLKYILGLKCFSLDGICCFIEFKDPKELCIMFNHSA